MEQDFESRYEFELDRFQRESIDSLAQDRSVLLVAPTGSGKTVVAEYGIHRALEGGGKAFYTTPLKALSNQKFRDFRGHRGSGEVGLLTGDNSINPRASLVVMTTEVLRNMIYEHSRALDRLSVVVLDECHYLHDPYRGAVWEEIIINLPGDVKLVALSATVSNADELGDWMDQVRGEVDIVVATGRPVPLKYYYFVGSTLTSLFSKGLHRQISDYHTAAKSKKGGGRRRKGGSRRSRLAPRRTDAIRRLRKEGMLPAIYFIFSRAGCDAAVEDCMMDGLDLTSASEKDLIRGFLEERVRGLSGSDLESLNYRRWKSNLIDGVASHHAGVIPLFKEVIEELFTRGAIKVVFATETLSLGINMPARTVVIESLTKYSGTEHRVLNPGEFTQLSGRAGRRGIDPRGNVVILFQGRYPLEVVRALARSEASPLASSFRVSYNMAVNLLSHLDEDSAVKVLTLSFAQHQADREVVVLEQKREALQEEHDSVLMGASCVDGGDAVSYKEILDSVNRAQKKLDRHRKERLRREVVRRLKELEPGDMFEWVAPGGRKPVAVVRKSKGKSGEPALTVVDGSGRFRKVSPRNILVIPRVTGRVKPDRISSPSKKVRKSAMADISRGARDTGGSGESISEDTRERELRGVLEEGRMRIDRHVCQGCEHLDRCLESAKRVMKIRRSLKKISREMEEKTGILARDFARVVGVLEELGYLDDGSVTDSGDMLRKIYNECDLLIAEVVRAGVLHGMKAEELASLCSWFVYESRGDSEDSRRRREKREEEFPTESLYRAYLEVDRLRRDIESLESKKRARVLGTVDIGFGALCYAWARGDELGRLLDEFPEQSPGDMVRSVRQVIDLLRQLSDAVSEEALRSVLEEAIRATHRGVVAFDSLSDS